MRWAALLAALVLALGGCAGGGGDDVASPPGAGPGQTAKVMAAAVLQLVTVDHTFGDGPPPFRTYLVQSRLDRRAKVPGRRLTAVEREAIRSALSQLGRVRFVDDPGEWRTPELQPALAGSAIVGVGEPAITADTALAPVSLWCGGLCGTWLTYRLRRDDGAWRVVGTKGPITIA